MADLALVGTDAPLRTLEQIEASIQRSMTWAQAAAVDLYEIKTRALWKGDEYRSWADYVVRRWNISESTASRWVHLGQAITIALTTGKTPDDTAPRRGSAPALPSQRQVEQARRKVSPIDAKSRPKPYVGPRAIVVIGDSPPAPDLAALAADLLADIEGLVPDAPEPEPIEDDEEALTPAVLLHMVMSVDPSAWAAEIKSEGIWRCWDAWVSGIEDSVPEEWL